MSGNYLNSNQNRLMLLIDARVKQCDDVLLLNVRSRIMKQIVLFI